MGYILPVDNYQYQAYQERIKRKKRTAATAVNKPFKAVLDKKHEEVKTNHERLHQKATLRPKPAFENEDLFAKMTGKGNHFSKTV